MTYRSSMLSRETLKYISTTTLSSSASATTTTTLAFDGSTTLQQATMQSLKFKFGPIQECTLNDYMFGKNESTSLANCQLVNSNRDNDSSPFDSPPGYDFYPQDDDDYTTSLKCADLVRDKWWNDGGCTEEDVLFADIEPIESLFPTPPESPIENIRVLLSSAEPINLTRKEIASECKPHEECSEVKKLLLSSLQRSNRCQEHVIPSRNSDNRKKLSSKKGRQTSKITISTNPSHQTSVFNPPDAGGKSYNITHLPVENNGVPYKRVKPSKDHNYCIINTNNTPSTSVPPQAPIYTEPDEPYRNKNPILAGLLLDPNLGEEIARETKLTREMSKKMMSPEFCNHDVNLNAQFLSDYLNTQTYNQNVQNINYPSSGEDRGSDCLMDIETFVIEGEVLGNFYTELLDVKSNFGADEMQNQNLHELMPNTFYDINNEKSYFKNSKRKSSRQFI